MTISNENEQAPAAAKPKAKNSVSPAKAPAKETKVPVESPRRLIASGEETDEVRTSALVSGAYGRKSLSVHHLQARLADLGYHEASADQDGDLGMLTTSSINLWQKDHGYDVGPLTIEQTHALFDGDINVIVVVDTYE